MVVLRNGTVVSGAAGQGMSRPGCSRERHIEERDREQAEARGENALVVRAKEILHFVRTRR